MEDKHILGLIALALILVFLTSGNTNVEMNDFNSSTNELKSGGPNHILPTYGFSDYSEEELYDICSGLEFKETVKCITSFVQDIYEYRYTPSGQDVENYTQLKTLGGDCRDWSRWLKKVYGKLGFVGDTAFVTYPPTMIDGYNVTGHTYSWFKSNSHSNEYCVYVDDVHPMCGTYEDELDFSYKIINLTSVEQMWDMYDTRQMEVLG